MNDHSAKWDAIARLLREASNGLPGGGAEGGGSPAPVGLLTGTLDEFEEFLEHNELELAWDALRAVAERLQAPAVCWRRLARAASLMGLPGKEEEALRQATPQISSDRALHIARQDAEKAYRDLLGFRITIAFEPDGWHVDYEVAELYSSGGGPHYVIDPMNGDILSKRYDK